MQNVTNAERKRLSEDVRSLGHALSAVPRPLGLKQRAKSAFLKQLRDYKRAQLDELCGGLGEVRTAREADAKRVQRI